MATIGKKFIEPQRWEQAWFARLSPGQKLLYSYLWERADHAGVIEIVFPVWSAHIGQTIDESTLTKLMQIVNKDVDRINIYDDKVFLCEYIRFQQKPDKQEALSGTHGFTKTIARLLKGHGLYDEVKKRDPILFSAFEDENTVSDSSEPYPSLAQDYGKGLSKSPSRSRSQSQSVSGSPTPAEGQEAGSYADAADRCLKTWSSRSDEVYFMEHNMLEDYIKEMCEEGESLEDVESGIIGYLQAEKGNGSELIEVLESITNQ